jgi:protein-S-isoprenylcysteine O-methyltransferase Ste14
LQEFFQLIQKTATYKKLFGLVIAFWSTPVITIAHLFFAVLTTTYILTAIQFKEKDLTDYFREPHKDYKRTTPMIIPFIKRKSI